MKSWIATIAVISALMCADATGAVTTTVVDLAVGSHTQRFLYLRPDAPVANIVYLSGSDGVLDIQPDGTMPGNLTTVKCGPVVRLRQQFADQNFSVALVDRNSVGDVHEFADVNEVIRNMQVRDNVPTWLIGGSSSTPGTMTISTQLPAASPVGIVIFSPDEFFTAAQAALVTRPIEIVYNPLDVPQNATRLLTELTAATIKSLVTLNGGTDQQPCGHHLFAGQDAEFLAAVTGFINQYNGTVSPPPLTVPVIEYYHQLLDHYFMTALQSDIDALDQHIFPGWERTGETFKAYPSQVASTVPVCRFFIPPEHGSSHFFSAKAADCAFLLMAAADPVQFPSFSGYEQENAAAFFVTLPDGTGLCPAGTVPVFRLWNQRFDSNHRYTTKQSIVTQMQARNFVIEGDAPNLAAMCGTP